MFGAGAHRAIQPPHAATPPLHSKKGYALLTELYAEGRRGGGVFNDLTAAGRILDDLTVVRECG